MKNTKPLLLIILLLAVLFSVPAFYRWQRANNCNEIISENLRPFPFDLNHETVEPWIQENYGVDVYDQSYSGNFDWTTNRQLFYLSLNENDVEELLVHFFEPHPTVDRFLECFGRPDLYSAIEAEEDGINFVMVDLLYLNASMVVETSLVLKEEAVSDIDGTMQINAIRWVRPGPAESMIVSRSIFMFPADITNKYDAFKVDALEPWPNS